MRPQKIHKVVFVRHGQSAWNKSNQFSGWCDIPLTDQGKEEARAAGKRLKAAGYNFDLAYTSMLKRAIVTYNCIADEMDLDWIPCHKHWRLNERHYGELQGLNKKETAKKYGEDQVLKWRRSYDNPPPMVNWDDDRHPRFNDKYSTLPGVVLPAGESLKMAIQRVIPFWQDTICPAVMDNKKVIVVAHENVLRGIVQTLSGMSNEEILHYNIPTATPFVYEFDRHLNPLRYYYLLGEDLDEAAIAAKEQEVANQGKADFEDNLAAETSVFDNLKQDR